MDKKKPNGGRRDDWRTPSVFWDALVARFGQPEWDLAASKENALCVQFVDEEGDSLGIDWPRGPLLFCNPPFSRKREFIRKAFTEAQLGARTIMLLPVDTSCEWFSDLVRMSSVILLRGRIQFTHPDEVGGSNRGQQLLALFDRMSQPGISLWDWKNLD